MLYIGRYKSSADAEMGDRLATVDMGRKVRVAVPLSGGAGSPSNNLAWAEAYFHAKWHLDTSSRLATTDMGRKLEAVLPFWTGGWVPSNTMWRDRGLPSYQVAS